MTEGDSASPAADSEAVAGATEPAKKTARAGSSGDPFAEIRGTWGFPAFAEDFPHDAELAALVAAFAEGDYAAVRTGAPRLSAKTKDDEVKRAADLLRARIEPDPSSRLFFGLTAALLVFLFVWWAAHDGPQHSAPAPAQAPPAVEFVK